MNNIPDSNNNDEHIKRRKIWSEKPHIRLVYSRWVEMMKPYLPEEPILEVGSGSGLLKDLMPEVVLSDTVELPWIDRIVNCLDMPFNDEEMGGIIAFDLLHHLSEPHTFLSEAARVLRPGGRILLIEPYITPFSYLGYKLFHHEAINFKSYDTGLSKGFLKEQHWHGNIALANLVFKKDINDWSDKQPHLEIIQKRLMSFFDFQLAAGFKPYAYIPYKIFKKIVFVDDWLKWLMPLIGFRIFVVIEKKKKS